MHLLGCFTAEAPELRLTDLSTCLGINKAQVLRIASTLEAGGFLVRNPSTRKYRLGIGLFHLGMLVQRQLDLRQIAHPFLQRLVAETQETARLVVPDPEGPICVDLVESPKGIRVFAQLGMRMPWNAGASPRVILAYLPEAERERVLSRDGFRSFTEHTTTDPSQLRAQLEEIRSRGNYVVSNDLDDGATGVSAPIFDHQCHIVGAINVSGPSSRLSPDDVEQLVTLISTAAGSISQQLGHRAGHGTQCACAGVLGNSSDDCLFM